MDIAPLHSWNLTPSEAIALQKAWAGRIDTRTPLLHWELIAGADVSYNRFSPVFYAAVVVWRRERIGYRRVGIRIADISDRDERNALDERYRMAMEAINPLRQDRWAGIHAGARALGAADYVELITQSTGLDAAAVAEGALAFLTDSETLYFAALRRYLALIEIEGGDATVADLSHLMRGRSWDHYFDAARLVTTLPRVHVVLAGIEKLVPDYAAAMLQLRLLARSATGQQITSYTTFLSGPPEPGKEMHVVLLDNGRTTMRDTPLIRDALRCIRCAACAASASIRATSAAFRTSSRGASASASASRARWR